MDHLTNEEIIDFVQAQCLDTETMKLITKVNAHIGNCQECQKKVALFMKIQDKMDGFQREYEYQKESSPESVTLHQLKMKKNHDHRGENTKVRKRQRDDKGTKT